ncbi:hypothetical protein PanWU01x14_361790, partial [Parasponia andersonii]
NGADWTLDGEMVADFLIGIGVELQQWAFTHRRIGRSMARGVANEQWQRVVFSSENG